MDISKESLEEFKEIYYKEFGERLSDDEARESAINLLSFMKILIETDRKLNKGEIPDSKAQ